MANNKGNLSQKEIDKQIATLRASYEMYEKSKIDTQNRRKNARDKRGNRIYSDDSLDATLKLIETSQADIRDKYLELGGKEEDLYVAPKNGKKGVNRDKIEALLAKERAKMDAELSGADDAIPFENAEYNVDVISEEEDKPNNEEIDVIALVDKDVKPEPIVEKHIEEPVTKEEVKKTLDDDKDKFGFSSVNMDIAKAVGNNIKYDVIPLPSRGKCYKSRISKLPVAYLTAYDENVIMSPNMYQDGSFLDYIIKSKIMTSKIDTDELVPGDREAILVWLRASGYGPLYPIVAKDPTTGKEFNTDFDLSEINYRKFDLVPDENGNFEYTLPNTKDVVKFKFLSYKDIKELSEQSIKEDSQLRKSKMIEMSENIKFYIEEDTNMSSDDVNKLTTASNILKEYADKIDDSDSTAFNHFVTNRLERSIVSVNGVTDRKYISEYVTYLNIKDSNALNMYIRKNEPGLDLNVKVKRPESLGGGSIDVFLTLDQFMFLKF